jgi:hypothetical protein
VHSESENKSGMMSGKATESMSGAPGDSVNNCGEAHSPVEQPAAAEENSNGAPHVLSIGPPVTVGLKRKAQIQNSPICSHII